MQAITEIHRDPISRAIARAQANLFRLQHDDGYWCGELFVDSTLCSDYVLYMHWAGEVDPVLQEKCVAHIRRRQLEDGGWNIYEDGPSDINASVKAYFALKLAGTRAHATVDAGSARLHFAPGRNSADEYLRETLPRAPRTVPLEVSPDRARGDGLLPEVVPVQSPRTLLLEPRHA
jgi:hypothetical protein